jgi:hypothetical protein
MGAAARQGVLDALGVSSLPAAWERCWEQAVGTFPGSGGRFLSNAAIIDANSVLFLSDEKLRLFQECAGALRARPDLALCAWLWHAALFEAAEFPAFRDVVQWPYPAAALGAHAAFFHGIALLSGLPWLVRQYRRRGIPRKIMVDTLSEFDICMDEHKARFGGYGIGPWRTNWLLYHFSARLYRIGRLEYEIGTWGRDTRILRSRTTGRVVTLQEEPGAVAAGQFQGREILASGHPRQDVTSLPAAEWEPVFSPGDPVVRVHITLGERMPADACRLSLAMAVDFLAKHFPEHRYRSFSCDSWLMDPQLKDLLPPGGNIARFQELFSLFPLQFSDGDVFRFAFDLYERPSDLRLLPERSSMHTALKAHLVNGGHILCAGGYISTEACAAYEMPADFADICRRSFGPDAAMTSRERVRAALTGGPVDYVPCAYICSGAEVEEGPLERAAAQGLDPVLVVDLRDTTRARAVKNLADRFGFATTLVLGAGDAEPALAALAAGASAGVDIVLRRGADLRGVRDEAALVRAAGGLYVVQPADMSSSGLGAAASLGVNGIAGIDTAAPRAELDAVHRAIAGRASAWAGPGAAAAEGGDEGPVRAAVARAFDVFGKRRFLAAARGQAAVEQWRRLRIFP